jgi:hypothetical protein
MPSYTHTITLGGTYKAPQSRQRVADGSPAPNDLASILQMSVRAAVPLVDPAPRRCCATLAPSRAVSY